MSFHLKLSRERCVVNKLPNITLITSVLKLHNCSTGYLNQEFVVLNSQLYVSISLVRLRTIQ